MCNTTQQQQPVPSGDTSKELTALDVELKCVETQMRIAELQNSMDYNRSLAGQMQRQFETFQRMAKPLSESNFVPAAYKGNLGDCVIAVEIACRLQILPLTVMQNLCVVKGKPTWSAKFLIGCVNTCGRYSTLDYRFTIDGKVGDVSYKTWVKREGKNTEVLKPFEHPELDNVVCVAYAIEKATGKELVSPPVSIRMAVGEGWYSKDGSKWPTMPELMLRWIQFGVFTPIFRSHATKDERIERRMWKFSNFPLMREAVKLRYALFPYIYTMARKTYDTGVGICRPLYYEYPDNEEAYAYEGEYLFGDNILVAPITEAAQDGKTSLKEIWFPKGKWWSVATNEMIEGPCVRTMHFSDKDIPYF